MNFDTCWQLLQTVLTKIRTDFLSVSWKNKCHRLSLCNSHIPYLTICMLGNFSCICCRMPTFFKISFFKNFFQKHLQSVRWFGSRSGPTHCQSWSGSKLFENIISRKQKSTLAREYSKTCGKRPLVKMTKNWFSIDYRLMQVKSIAECSKGSILKYFRPSLTYHL